MPSESIVVDVNKISKIYEIYQSPSIRLKQLILNQIDGAINRFKPLLFFIDRKNKKKFFKEFEALKNISFQVRRGETVGIIGRNGSGKSTLLQIIAGTLAQTSGDVVVKGRVAALLELGSGFDPEFTGKENVYLNCRLLGLSEKEIISKYDEIVAFSEVGEYIDQPVKTYSSGMYMRLAFSVQAHIEATLIIIDEALAVGDVFFRNKCYEKLNKLKESGAAIILVTHSMPEVEQFCDYALLLNNACIEYFGNPVVATKKYYLLNQESSEKNKQKNIKEEVDKVASLTNREEVSNGKAICTLVASYNLLGEQCNNFKQGEIVELRYEFEIKEDIEVPILGAVLSNDRGVIVFGKNSWQDLRVNCVNEMKKGSKILVKQRVNLDLAAGDYLIEVGLATVRHDLWKDRNNQSYNAVEQKFERICHVPAAVSITILPKIEKGLMTLDFHGLVNLDSSFYEIVVR